MEAGSSYETLEVSYDTTPCTFLKTVIFIINPLRTQNLTNMRSKISKILLHLLRNQEIF
jgi:hypothetical protein